jgi:hypothetical protein
MDMTASEGGSRSGEDETVAVMRDRRTLVRGMTANGAGGTIFARW